MPIQTLHNPVGYDVSTDGSLGPGAALAQQDVGGRGGAVRTQVSNVPA